MKQIQPFQKHWLQLTSIVVCRLKANRLSPNLKKTQYMIFTGRKTTSEKIDIKIDHQNISETKSSKFLGVYIDNSLNWKKHICYIAGKISRGIGIILKSRKYLNEESLLTLYYCFIYPFLIYCNNVWGNTYKTNLSKLQILQNQVLRIITGSKPRCLVDPLYKNLGILNLSEINVYLTGMFMYKIYNQDVPHVFDDFFMYNYEVHDHDTRSSNYFHVPHIKSNLSAFGIKYHGVIIWNKILKAKLKPDCSELSFKMMLKNIYCKNLLHANDHFNIYYLSTLLIYLYGKSISNSVLPAQSAPLHPVSERI